MVITYGPSQIGIPQSCIIILLYNYKGLFHTEIIIQLWIRFPGQPIRVTLKQTL